AVDMAARAGVPKAVLVHFRADLRERVEAACGRRTGAIGGRPGLVVEVGRPARASSAAAPSSGAADGTKIAVDGAPAAADVADETPLDANADGPQPRAIDGIAPARLP